MVLFEFYLYLLGFVVLGLWSLVFYWCAGFLFVFNTRMLIVLPPVAGVSVFWSFPSHTGGSPITMLLVLS